MTTDNKPATAAPPASDPARAPHHRPAGAIAWADAATIETDREGRVVAWSAAAQAVFGWTAQEVLASSADRMFTPQDLANHRAATEMQCALVDGRSDDERWHLRKSGALFWGQSEMLALRDSAGVHRGYLKRVRDITRDREVAAAQRAEAEFLRSVLGASGDCIKVLDLEARLSFMSERGQRLLEISDFNALRGCDWTDLWQQQGNTDAKAAVAAAKAGGIGHFVATSNTATGTPKWWDVQITPIIGADGRPDKLLCVSRDITETRVTEDALQDVRNLNTLILNASRDSIVVLDLEGRTRFVSPGGIENLEIADVASVIGKSFVRAWTGADQTAARAALDQARAGGTGRFEGFCATHKGTPKWWDVMVCSLAGTAGQPQRLVAIGRDISDARHVAQRLAVTEDRLTVALSASGAVGTWDWDLATGLVHADANYARIYGFDAARAAAGAPMVSYLESFHADDLPSVRSQIETTRAGGANFSSEYRIVRPDGSIRWIFARGRLVHDARGVAVRFAGTSVDITERKSAELRQAFQLRLSDRLRAHSEPQAVLAAAAEALGAHLRAGRVGFGEVRPDDTLFFAPGGHADGAEPLHGSFAMRRFGAAHTVRLHHGATVVCGDVAADAELDPTEWTALPVRAFVAVPLIRDGRLTAVLYVDSGMVQRWSADEVALVQEVAERAHDACERARAERDLRISETRLHTAVAITSLGTFEWDTGTDTVVLSPRGRTIFGFGPNDALQAETIFGRMHPQDVKRVRSEAAAVMRVPAPLETSYRIVLPGGAVRWIKSVSGPVAVPDGQAGRVVGVFEDITDRVLAEQALRTSESQFRMLAQSVPHHVWTARAVGQMEWFNERAYAYCGVPDGSLEGTGWTGALHPDDLHEGLRLWEEAGAADTVFQGQFRLRRADGA